MQLIYKISSTKVVVPELTSRVVDRAEQVFGGAGVSQDFLVARAWQDYLLYELRMVLMLFIKARWHYWRSSHGRMIGANINATFTSSTHFSFCSGVKPTLTHKVSNTSVLPHADDTDPLPAMATVVFKKKNNHNKGRKIELI